ncbi:MAG TPA: ATP-grasp domain-containing protein [Candidatus Baltobacteraceae bacterium]|nr:ATP-grasp domain-containing protein [Candidatus Baltobacteraceae bacterium]
MHRVFVTDGSYRNALAAVRALGSAGFRVTVGERGSIPPSTVGGFWSRHCAQTFRYPDPNISVESTVAALRAHFNELRYDAVIPVGLDMVELFVRNRLQFNAPLLLPSAESFAIAADKRRTFEHAAHARIPIPKTLAAQDWREIEPPLVFKHPRAGAHVARNAREASSYALGLGESIRDYLAQEFVPGENGFGYFALFDEGREVGYFMHERLVQYPKEGGPSVIARSIRDPHLRELGRSLLESMRWHGVAMVEFKRSDRDGEYYLIEVNPKLWGSLDLAIQAGCNFPVWIAQRLMGAQAPLDSGYREGLTYQWVIPVGLKSFVRYPEFRVRFVRNVFSRDVRTDLSLFDPLPTAAGLLAMAGSLTK